MKKAIVFFMAIMTAAALAGCGGSGSAASSAASSAAGTASAASVSSAAESAADESAAESTAAESASDGTAAESTAAESAGDAAEDESTVTESMAYPEGQDAEDSAWTEAGSAEEAAKGADCGTFEVPEEIALRDIEYLPAAYSYRDKVAQALYEAPATEVYIRKAKGIYGTPLTDRDTESEFTEIWTEDINGLEVYCYGFAKEEAIVMQWNIDDEAYAITSQGLGGEEVGVDTDTMAKWIESIK